MFTFMIGSVVVFVEEFWIPFYSLVFNLVIDLLALDTSNWELDVEYLVL